MHQQGTNIAKYHETVNMAIESTISRPFGGEHTPRSCMLAAVAKTLHKTHRKSGVIKEMEGWELGGSPELLPGDDDDDGGECNDE